MAQPIPKPIADALQLADPTWRLILENGLRAISCADPEYLQVLAEDQYLPTRGRLFAAFTLPFDAVKFVLVGEGPYPREASATGVCFMDGAVEMMWSDAGLSKEVNRATSLRNFVKMLLVADNRLSPEYTSGTALASIAQQARAPGSPFIQTLTELQSNLTRQGFLLLNASLVYRKHVAPVKDAKAWRPFLGVVLEALASRRSGRPTLVLWGKIAGQLGNLEPTPLFPSAVSEHPYNLSFIRNESMQRLFAPMRLLIKQN